MSVKNQSNVDPECEQTVGWLEAFLDNTLREDASGALRRHLAGCSHCVGELEGRRNLRARLKSAVEGVETPEYLAARIRVHLREGRNQSSWLMSLAAVAAGVSIFALTTVSYQHGHMRWTRGSQEAYIGSVSSRVAGFMRVGLGDHVHCAVFRKYPQNPPPMDESVAKVGSEYSGIIPIVLEHVPNGFRLQLAHRCTYRSRQFVHMVLRSDSALLSVVITRKRDGETLRPEELAPELSEAGISIYHSSVQRFDISAFEARDHMVYVISDLPAQHNTELMQAMAPALNSFLARLAG